MKGWMLFQTFAGTCSSVQPAGELMLFSFKQDQKFQHPLLTLKKCAWGPTWGYFCSFQTVRDIFSYISCWSAIMSRNTLSATTGIAAIVAIVWLESWLLWVCLSKQWHIQLGGTNKASHLRPVTLGGQPLHDLGHSLFPRFGILSTHKHRLIELQQGCNISWKIVIKNHLKDWIKKQNYS